MSLRWPQRTYIFEIVGFHNCHGYEQKISSAVGNDLVKIDPKDGHVTVSTRLLPERVRLALEEKTRRKVVLLYELIPINPTPSLRDSSHHTNRPSLPTLTHHTNRPSLPPLPHNSNRPSLLSLPNNSNRPSLPLLPPLPRHINRTSLPSIPHRSNTPCLPPNTAPGHQHGSMASTSNHVSSHSKSQTMKMTIRYQNKGTTVDAPPGQGHNTTNSLRRYGKIYHQHNLTLTKGSISSYMCSGCKELGIGDRYICNHCSYILHSDCMYYKRITTHKFLNGSTFKFHQTRFDRNDRYCDACGSDIKGFFYHCENTSKDLHPCCLQLTETVHVGEIKFRLCRNLTSHECFYCSSRKKDNKDNCWCYSLESQDLQAHVSCMKDALRNCLKGERNNNMSIMVGVLRGKRTSEGLKWAERLLKVAVCVLSGNPFPLLEVALELFE